MTHKTQENRPLVSSPCVSWRVDIMCNLFENNDSLFDIMRLSDGGLLIKIRYKDFSGQFVYYIEDDIT